jgi:hypothetical protein
MSAVDLMRRILLVLATLGIAVQSQAAVGVRLIMGITDTGLVRWDGSVTATGGQITRIEPRRGMRAPAPTLWMPSGNKRSGACATIACGTTAPICVSCAGSFIGIAKSSETAEATVLFWINGVT